MVLQTAASCPAADLPFAHALRCQEVSRAVCCDAIVGCSLMDGQRTGTLSVHVRHGDKGSEMQLMPDEEYVKAAESMLKGDNHLQKNIFLSTEDPATIEHFTGLPGWSVQYHTDKADSSRWLGSFSGVRPNRRVSEQSAESGSCCIL